MKKIIPALLLSVIILALSACTSGDTKAFDELRSRVEAAGYEVSDAYVDANFEDVVSAFTVKVNFDANTVATIPVILTKSERAAKNNCEKFGDDSIKLPIQNGKVFSYPGRDYPEDVITLITHIINGEEIPENPHQ
ncbi:MAG: hypothetical protein II996_06320 [Oscillospiraceae bacterium]|nr:hypothetical protein [Oscillospiraceae bacterium]MBQ6902787.1 hypothetical protein [Oscillospiraceae bacterium]